MTSITDVRGVGPAILRHLTALGLKNAEDVAEARPEELSRATGIGPARAPALIAAARAAIGLDGARKPKASARTSKSKGRFNSVALHNSSDNAAGSAKTSSKKKKKAAAKVAAVKAAKNAAAKLRKLEQKAQRKADEKAAKKKADLKAKKKALKAAKKKKEKKAAKKAHSKAKKSKKRKLCKA